MKVVTKMMFCGVLAGGLAIGAPGRNPARNPARNPGAGQAPGLPPGPPAADVGAYTTVSGKVTQLNYDRDAQVEGFLLNDRTLVHLPPQIAPRIGSSFKAGDTVQVAGFERTGASGFESLEAQNIQDRTSGRSITVPTPGAAAPYSGAGRIRQLNYDADGAVNGFMLDNGTFVTMPPFGADNPSSIRAGGSIAFSGYARKTLDGRTVVDVQTLSVNGQTLNVAAAGPAAAGPGGPTAPPAPPRGMLRNAPPPPPSPAGPAPAAVPPAPPTTPAGTAEPPAPPAPPQR